MKLDKRFLLVYFLLILSLPLAISGVINLLNLFSNSCIKGDCKNGYGVYVYSSGMRYEGEWKHGKRHGKGTLLYPDGSRYTGEWRNNRMHGYGTKIYASDILRKKYEGEWRDGRKHGRGTLIYSSGSVFGGEWKEGQKHGHGTLTLSDGRKIIGKWKDGVLSESTEIYPDGKIIIARLKNEKKNGPGIIIYPDGTKVKGLWIKNKLVGSLEFYLFRGGEFEEGYDIASLCRAIKADIAPSLKSPENSIAWLNELLKTPDLYEKYSKKIKPLTFPEEINNLIERTKGLRKKRFSEINVDSQKDIVKLNRLLIEHLYPDKTPKVPISWQD